VKLKYDEPLSNAAFNFNLVHYNKVTQVAEVEEEEEGGEGDGAEGSQVEDGEDGPVKKKSTRHVATLAGGLLRTDAPYEEENALDSSPPLPPPPPPPPAHSP